MRPTNLNTEELNLYLDLKDDMDNFNKLLGTAKIQGYLVVVQYKKEEDQEEESSVNYYFSALNESNIIGATEKINKGLMAKYIHNPKTQ